VWVDTVAVKWSCTMVWIMLHSYCEWTLLQWSEAVPWCGLCFIHIVSGHLQWSEAVPWCGLCFSHIVSGHCCSEVKLYHGVDYASFILWVDTVAVKWCCTMVWIVLHSYFQTGFICLYPFLHWAFVLLFILKIMWNIYAVCWMQCFCVFCCQVVYIITAVLLHVNGWDNW
jgi:hypothetical protein